ncbi:MAG: M56 family metallopeptidase [Kofleriaceae bacterium]
MSALVQAGHVAKDAMATLGMMAVQGTVLALIAIALVRIGRPRPAWRAAIWTIVLVKFALPWGPAMPWSLSDLVASLSTSPAVHAPVVIPAGPVVAVAPSVWPAIGWLVLAAIWLAGAAFVFVRALRSQRAAVRFARNAPLAGADATLLLRELAAKMRVRRARLVVGDDAMGPYVVGVLRPIIVAPPSLLADPALLRAALLHELAHVRRLDAIGRALQLVATSMFFFWPVVRLVGKRLDLAREAACDAWALESSEVSRPAYARLLVNMASLRSAAAANLAVRRTLDARVSAVLGPAVRARLGVVHWLALGAWAAVALGGARSATAHASDETCRYTPELANALYVAHPEADRDRDGYLSKDEACVFQFEFVRARAHGAQLPPSQQVSTLSDEAQQQLDQLLSEPLCCNCGPSDGMTPAAAGSVDTSCQRAEGEAP